MPFLTECFFCLRRLRVPDHAAGLSARCPGCGNSFTVVALGSGPARPDAKPGAADPVADAAAVLPAEPGRKEAGEPATVVQTPSQVAASAAGSKTAPPPSLPGYEVLGRLGEGGTGIVFKARQLSLNRIVAVKVLHHEHKDRPNALARFRREAEAAARVLHPNVVLTFEAEQAGDALVLVMEYVEGVDLARLVKKHGALPPARACDFIRQAALGLQHAHERGLIHRDIKPHNLMLTSEETKDGQANTGAGTIKILDFGLARFHRPLHRKGSAGTLTEEGDLLGTPDFIAPEQARNPRKVDGRADLYSLGCTFYFLLTGRPLFDSGTPSEKLWKHWAVDPTPVNAIRPEVSPQVARVVHRLLEKKPEDRYPSAAALVDAFNRLLDPAGPRPAAAPRPAAPPGRGLATLVSTFSGHDDGVHAVALSPDGKLALSGSRDHTLRVWDLAGGRQVQCLTGHQGPVRGIGFSPNGRYAVSAGEDRTVRVWDVESGWELRRLNGHGELVTAAAFLPDGQRVISASHDRTMRVWEVRTGQELSCLAGQMGPINAMIVAPDGCRVFAGSEDRKVHVWDIVTDREVQRLAPAEVDDPGPVVASLALSPDGGRLLAAGSDHVLHLWDVAKGQRLARLTGHAGWIGCLAFAPDGRRALSGSWDRTVRLWNTETRKEQGRLDLEVDSATFSADGQRILLGGRDRTVTLWALSGA